jgi:hypothetical protein
MTAEELAQEIEKLRRENAALAQAALLPQGLPSPGTDMWGRPRSLTEEEKQRYAEINQRQGIPEATASANHTLGLATQVAQLRAEQEKLRRKEVSKTRAALRRLQRENERLRGE